MSKVIEIKWNDLVYLVLVDDGAYEVLSRHTWYIMYSGVNKKPYAFAELYSKPKGQERIKRMFYMHQMVVGSFTQIDHINGNSLDNRFENLRPATYQENGWNKPKNMNRRKDGRTPSSQFKGVSYVPLKGKPRWAVLISKGKGKGVIRGGYYDDEIEAAQVYNKMVKEIRGDFAWLNPIPQINHAN